MVKRRTQTRNRTTKHLDLTTIIILLVVGLVGFSFLMGLSLNSNPEKQALQVQEQQAVLPFRILSKQAGYVMRMFATLGFYVVVGYVLYYLVAIARNWLDLRSRQVQAQNGVFPVIQLSKGAYYDPNRDNAGAHPIIALAALETQRQSALAKAERITVRTSSKALKPPKESDMPALEQVSNLPDMVKLPQICQNPTLNNLVLGMSENGVITASLYELMHVLSVGASGFGKSAFLRMLIWQLAQVPQDVGIVAIDINGSEFNNIRQWSRLLYPVARDTNAAIATLNAVSQELEYRKGLYESVPTAYDLPSYNALASEQLAPIAILADEATNLLNQDGIGEPLRAVTQCARQYGIYLLLAGQSAKAKVIDTQIRDNFSTRLCFATSPTSYRTVLGQSVDGVTTKGRAWAQLVGEPLQQIQTPFVSREDVQRVLTVGEPQNVIEADFMNIPAQVVDDKEQQILELFNDDSLSDSKIARQVYGYSNARTVEKVQELRRRRQSNYV